MKQIIATKVNGVVTYDKPIEYVFATLKNGRYIVTIKGERTKRSVSQNDLMWMWFTCIENETGTPKNDVYMYYCKKFLAKLITLGNKTEWIYRTSSTLDTAEMTNFLNLIQADAATELGITLPVPEDMFFEQFANEYDVQRAM